MQAWQAMTVEQTAAELETDVENGLSEHEAKHRLASYGPNSLEEKKRTPWPIRFLLQFNDFMIYVLLAAIVISGVFLEEYLDAAVIGIIVLLNAFLGFMQESRAESAIEKLKELSAPTASVVRDGKEREVLAADLVPGDLMIIEAGDSISADTRVTSSASLLSNESSLTGESEAVSKDADATIGKDAGLGDMTNMVFAGTHIEYGRGAGIVVETGPRSQIGQIAGMLQETKQERTPLQTELNDVGRRIVYICLAIVTVVFATGLLRGNGAAEMLLVAVSLAVAAIPEGLPAIVNITLARGTQVMAKENAIIRNLPAVETLGSADFICSDKTGTLTMNRMTVTDILFADAVRAPVAEALDGAISDEGSWRSEAYRRMLTAAALCNDARKGGEGFLGDPTETALVQAAENAGIEKHALEGEHPRVEEVPFDSDRKMMTTFNRSNGSYTAYTKGAVEQVLAKCSGILKEEGIVPINESDRVAVLEATTAMASEALRTLGFAVRTLERLPVEKEIPGLESELTFLGVFAMKDPPRPEALDALDDCRDARIEVAMITGDHKATAAAVARELGILGESGEVIEGNRLQEMTAERLEEVAEKARVYARVSPRHKVNIVEALKARGHVVAMTGDGVNDAPALKRADIGVAMGITGTDVSKEASDMVLADDNFATIVSAVRQGRIIFANLKKFIYFLLSCNISEVLVIFIAMVSGMPLPLVASQILWINLVTDGLPALALGMDPPEQDVMGHPPRKLGESILAARNQLDLFWQGALITAGALTSFILAHFWLGYSWDIESQLDIARTVLFTTLVFTQVLHSFNLRSQTRSIFSSPPWENRYLFGAFLLSIGLQVAVIYLPFMHKAFHTSNPTLDSWILILGCSIVPVLLIDRIKVIRASIWRKRAEAEAEAA